MKNHPVIETICLSVALGSLAVAMFCCAAYKADAQKYGSYQPYIVRNCVCVSAADSNAEGITTLQDEDSNLWELVDCGEMELGSRWRVLYESKGTRAPEDDAIIDFTEIQ